MRAMQVAEYMLAITRDAGFDKLDQMKLNKLLYLAQAHSLETTGEPLFDDPIEAFKNGPVVRPVEERFRYNKGGIEYNGALESINIDPDKEDIIIDVLSHYKNKSAISLYRMIHKPDNPWTKAYSIARNSTIPISEIKEFYSQPKNRVLSITELIERMAETVIEPTVDEDGCIVLPAEEYDEED